MDKSIKSNAAFNSVIGKPSAPVNVTATTKYRIAKYENDYGEVELPKPFPELYKDKKIINVGFGEQKFSDGMYEGEVDTQNRR